MPSAASTTEPASATSLQQPLLPTPSSTSTPTSTSTSTANSTTSAPPTSSPSRRTFRLAHPATYFLVLSGLTCLGLAAYFPTLPRPVSLLQPIVDLAYFLFREQWVVQAVFYTAIGLHIGEALWVSVSGVLGRKGVEAGWARLAWVGQTVLLGWGSVGLLRGLPDVQHSGSRNTVAAATG